MHWAREVSDSGKCASLLPLACPLAGAGPCSLAALDHAVGIDSGGSASMGRVGSRARLQAQGGEDVLQRFLVLPDLWRPGGVVLGPWTGRSPASMVAAASFSCLIWS